MYISNIYLDRLLKYDILNYLQENIYIQKKHQFNSKILLTFYKKQKYKKLNYYNYKYKKINYNY